MVAKKKTPSSHRKRSTPSRKGNKTDRKSSEDAARTRSQAVGDKFARVTVPPQLHDPEQRLAWGLPANESERGRYIIELNLQHAEGLGGASADLDALCQRILGNARRPTRISKTYYQCYLSVLEWKKLIREDEQEAKDTREVSRRCIYRLWPDFPITAQTDRSMMTIKADAALRSFAAGGDGITWAVIDSGIQGDHPHFKSARCVADDAVKHLHRCFGDRYEKDGDDWYLAEQQLADPDDPERKLTAEQRRAAIDAHVRAALTDDFGHGTHVAGIIAGEAPQAQLQVLERKFKLQPDGISSTSSYGRRTIAGTQRPRGVAPSCRLISLRVLNHKGEGHVSSIIRALEYIQEQINHDPKLLRVHGVNLSVGYEFDAEMFACGQSPLCTEVNRLVRAGVVVVTAAGNTGYGAVPSRTRTTRVGLSNTINDPGNAAEAITVGATHRDSPHTYGVSFFSSKGPTGDGRLKPDLVAPGERITSCSTGAKLDEALNGEARADDTAYYIDDSGTSMAAPHVSGAIAAFLSIRREFIGKPQDVKRIFLESATPLGRERYFEGRGLVDLMRAIQSV